jgi:hypothetical protein
LTHTTVLFIAYATVALLWLAASRVLPYWRAPARPVFAHPWREFGVAVAAAILVVLIGQFYVRGVRLPNRGDWRPLTESINQLVIFLPVLLVPVLRRQSWSTMWIGGENVLQRIGVGVALAMVALSLYVLLEPSAPDPQRVVAQVFSLSSVPIAVQVLLEDLTLALLVVRLGAALSPRWAIVATAALFALGHVPTMIAQGTTPAQLLGLTRDVALAALVLNVAWHSADILWIWPVHTTLDLTQFMS